MDNYFFFNTSTCFETSEYTKSNHDNTGFLLYNQLHYDYV